MCVRISCITLRVPVFTLDGVHILAVLHEDVWLASFGSLAKYCIIIGNKLYKQNRIEAWIHLFRLPFLFFYITKVFHNYNEVYDIYRPLF